jgi:hypothetical protein
MLTANVFDQPACLDSFQYSDDLCFCKSALTHFHSPLAYQFASRTPVMHGLILREGYSCLMRFAIHLIENYSKNSLFKEFKTFEFL